jgi:hypothetical protein
MSIIIVKTLNKRRGQMSKERVPTPVKTIRLKCLDCCGQQWKEVKLCRELACPLWPYRFGKRPAEEDAQAHIEAKIERGV